MSNSLPAHPSPIAACREAMEFSGNPVFLQAPRWAITLLAAKLPFSMVKDFSRIVLFPDEKLMEKAARPDLLKYFLPLPLRKSSFAFNLNKSAFGPVRLSVY